MPGWEICCMNREQLTPIETGSQSLHFNKCYDEELVWSQRLAKAYASSIGEQKER